VFEWLLEYFTEEEAVFFIQINKDQIHSDFVSRFFERQ
jgi:hypothetical protein